MQAPQEGSQSPPLPGPTHLRPHAGPHLHAPCTPHQHGKDMENGADTEPQAQGSQPDPEWHGGDGLRVCQGQLLPAHKSQPLASLLIAAFSDGTLVA